MPPMEQPVGTSSNPPAGVPAFPELKLLPACTGVGSLEAALHDPPAVRLLWLEILVNHRLDLGPWHDRVELRAAYSTVEHFYARPEPRPSDQKRAPA